MRNYVLISFLLIGLTAMLYFAGYMNEQVSTIVGFSIATLVFIGMSVVLPWSVGRQTAHQ